MPARRSRQYQEKHRRFQHRLGIEAFEPRIMLDANLLATIASDAYENNDSQAIVDARVAGDTNSPNLGLVTGTRTISGLTMEDAGDWYRFQIANLGSAANSVRVDFLNSQGDLDVRLRNSAGQVLETKSGINDGETVSLNGLPAGTYYLEVYGYNGATSPNYSITFNTPNIPTTSVPDAFENNDSAAQVDPRPPAAANSPNLGKVAGTRSVIGLTMEDSADWFKFQTTTAGTSANSVRIDFLNALGNLGMNLRDASGNLLATSNGTGDFESISLGGRAAGTYYVEVFGTGGATNPSYALTVNGPGTPGPVLPDAYENNDTAAIVDAASPGAFGSSNLGAIFGERTISDLTMEDGHDWYKFQTIDVGTAADKVAIDFLNAQGDLDMRLYDASGNLLQTRSGTNDGETIGLNGRAAGTYYVEVFGYRGATNPNYTLEIHAPGSPPTVSPDAYENNDSQAIVDGRPEGGANSPNLGQIIGTKTIAGLTMEDGGDWFKFSTADVSGANNRVRIDFLTSQGNLALSLFDASGNLLGASDGIGDSESVSLEGHLAGTYYIEVTGDDGATNPNYTLTIDAPQAPAPILSDAYEDNDSQAIVDAAQPGANSPNLGRIAGTKTIAGLTMEDTGDWYKFDLVYPGAADSAVRINFLDYYGKLGLNLRDSSGNLLGTSQGNGNTESVSLSGRAAGTYYVEVFGLQGASNRDYSLAIKTPPPPPHGILPDFYENNDSKAIVDALPAGAANSSNLGTVTGIKTIADLTFEDTADWYKFQIGATGAASNSVRIDFQNTKGNLGLRLHDATGKVVATSNGRGNVETISLKGKKAGVYYVEVFGGKGVVNPNYRLTLNTPGPVAPILPDVYENNDSKAIVDGLVAGDPNSSNFGVVTGVKTFTGLTMEDAGDWYKFQTTATGGAANSVRINFQNAQGNLGLRLRDATGKVVATSNLAGNSETISLKGKKAGTYYVEVFGVKGVRNPNYTLTLNAPGTTPNAAFAQAFSGNKVTSTDWAALVDAALTNSQPTSQATT